MHHDIVFRRTVQSTWHGLQHACMHACLHAYVHTFLRVCDNVSAHAVCTYTSCVCVCVCVCVCCSMLAAVCTLKQGEVWSHMLSYIQTMSTNDHWHQCPPHAPMRTPRTPPCNWNTTFHTWMALPNVGVVSKHGHAHVSYMHVFTFIFIFMFDNARVPVYYTYCVMFAYCIAGGSLYTWNDDEKGWKWNV